MSLSQYSQTAPPEPVFLFPAFVFKRENTIIITVRIIINCITIRLERILPVATIKTSAARMITSPINFEGDLIYFFTIFWTPKRTAGTARIRACQKSTTGGMPPNKACKVPAASIIVIPTTKTILCATLIR